MDAGSASISCVGAGVSLYATALPEIGLRTCGLAILTTMLVNGEASNAVAVVIGVDTTLYALPCGFVAGSIATGNDSSRYTVLACPSTAGSIRTAKMCWWF